MRTHKKSNRVMQLHVKLLAKADPRFDAKRQHKMLGLLEDIADYDVEGALSMWHEGAAFTTIRNEKLYLQAGFSSMTAFVEKGLHRSMAWVRHLMWFSDNFTIPQIMEHGRDKLLLGADYVGLTRKETDEAWKLEGMAIDVPENGRVVAKPFPKVTVPELRAAVEHQKNLKELRLDAALTPEQKIVGEQFADVVAHALAGSKSDGKLEIVPSPDGVAENARVKIDVPYGDFAKVLGALHRATK